MIPNMEQVITCWYVFYHRTHTCNELTLMLTLFYSHSLTQYGLTLCPLYIQEMERYIAHTLIHHYHTQGANK
jgi:hypothetical protein